MTCVWTIWTIFVSNNNYRAYKLPLSCPAHLPLLTACHCLAKVAFKSLFRIKDDKDIDDGRRKMTFDNDDDYDQTVMIM